MAAAVNPKYTKSLKAMQIMTTICRRENNTTFDTNQIKATVVKSFDLWIRKPNFSQKLKRNNDFSHPCGVFFQENACLIISLSTCNASRSNNNSKSS